MRITESALHHNPVLVITNKINKKCTRYFAPLLGISVDVVISTFELVVVSIVVVAASLAVVVV